MRCFTDDDRLYDGSDVSDACNCGADNVTLCSDCNECDACCKCYGDEPDDDGEWDEQEFTTWENANL